MTSRSSMYLQLLSVVTRWAHNPEPGDELRALAQLFTTLISAASEETRVVIKEDLTSLSERALSHELNEITQKKGPQIARAAQEITQHWLETSTTVSEVSPDASAEPQDLEATNTSDIDRLIRSLNTSLREREYVYVHGVCMCMFYLHVCIYV